jgi:hypothetical protein
MDCERIYEDGKTASYHCSPDWINVAGKVPLYRFMTRLREEKKAKALSAPLRSSSGMIPLQRG